MLQVVDDRGPVADGQQTVSGGTRDEVEELSDEKEGVAVQSG